MQVCYRRLANLGQVDNEGYTPAYFAAQHGHESCLRVLMNAGCDLGQANNYDKTPAYWAAANVMNHACVCSGG